MTRDRAASANRETSDRHLQGHPFTDAIEAAHERALTALREPDAPPLDAVVWLSAHLAAVEHVIYPVMDKVLRSQQEVIQRQRSSSQSMQKALRALEERSSGDAQASRASVEALRAALVPILAEHAAAEHGLLDEVAVTLDEGAMTSLLADYEHALSSGPTRPHPHGPHRGRLGQLSYTLDAVRDHILDIVDSRPVPLPRPTPVRRRLGRRGHDIPGAAQSDDELKERAGQKGKQVIGDPASPTASSEAPPTSGEGDPDSSGRNPA